MPLSHIWIGVLSEDAPQDFFEEQFEDEDAAVSPFAESQDEHWIDHDFLEISWQDETTEAAQLIDGHSWSDSYLDAVVGKAKELGLPKINTFVLCGSEQIMTPKSVLKNGIDLRFVGTFDCRD